METKRRWKLSEVKLLNPKWFSVENQAFFDDIGYKVAYGQKTGQTYLVQHTNGWTDFLDGVKKPHYRLHTIRDDGGIGELLDEKFSTREAVEEWLQDK